MKPSGRWSHCFFGNRYFGPTHCDKVEDPKIIQIADSLASKDNKVRVMKFCSVVGSLPRSRFINPGCNLNPFFGFPIEDIYGIKALLICSTSSEYDNSIVFMIVIHGTVRTMRRSIANSFDLSPFHCDSVKSPHIVHVIRV